MDDDDQQMTQKQKEEQMKAAQALQQVQTLLQAEKAIAGINRKCFRRCVGTPGKQLWSSEQQCVWNCAQRYIETQFFIQRRFQDLKDNPSMDLPFHFDPNSIST
mmetsp:Transcript_31651/g.75934  ORF Transcript_31651/g.75934 Transcript_31651/m.75934 type:complete len:104 (+) Transcript_31651:51-362(+)